MKNQNSVIIKNKMSDVDTAPTLCGYNPSDDESNEFDEEDAL